jgi:hypothetical protein
MADNWYFAQNNQQLGPVPLATLQAMARSGQLNGEDLVWREGMANWTAANQVPGIFGGGAPAQAGGWQGPAMGGPTYAAPAGYGGAQLGYRGQASGQSYKKEATQAFIWSLASLLCCGLLGIVAINQANAAIQGMDSSGNPEGRGLAVAARVIGIIALVLIAINIVIQIASLAAKQ